MVTPTSTAPLLRSRRPRHRADATTEVVVWILALIRPRSPPASRWTSELVEVRPVV